MRIESLRMGGLLKRIHIQIFEGEMVHCVFDNIQEKRAFIQIMSGQSKADYGKVYYEEQSVPEKRVQQLFREKVSVITKESNLIDSVTIVENIFLICPEAARNWVNHRQFKKEAATLFRKFGVQIDINKPMKKLSVFEKLEIEIMKAYFLGKKFIILTELSNLFSDKEKQEVRSLLVKLQLQGVSCMLLEPLEDIDFVYTDSVIVVKHGKTCLIKDIEDCNYLMLHTALYYDEMNKRIRENVLLSESSNNGSGVRITKLATAYLRDIDLEVERREITKLFCNDEKSYEEIVGVLRGQREIKGGFISSRGRTRNLPKIMSGLGNGIGIAEGNPAKATLFDELTVMDNLQILLSKKVNGVWTAPKYRKSIRLILKDVVSDDILKKKVKELNPSDVQKVLYSRWLLYFPELLVCIQPFAEGDIQARETARKMLYMLRERGIPILLITSNSAEFNYCIGREVYLRRGKIVPKEQVYELHHPI